MKAKVGSPRTKPNWKKISRVKKNSWRIMISHLESFKARRLPLRRILDSILFLPYFPFPLLYTLPMKKMMKMKQETTQPTRKNRREGVVEGGLEEYEVAEEEGEDAGEAASGELLHLP